MSRQRGFSLVELIVVIVLLGIVAVSTTQFVSQGLSIYVDTARRDNLQQQGRFAVERVSRELRNALPGSVRVAGNCVDFMPVLNASSYLQSVVTGAAISSLDIIDVGYSFGSGDRLAVYPIDSDSVYGSANAMANLTGASVSGNVQTLTFGSHQFVLESPTQRAFIAAPTVTFCATDGALTRNGVLIAEHIRIAENMVSFSAFAFTEGTLQRAGIVHLDFRFQDLAEAGEWVRFNHEISVRNTP